jgi:hypothetical protein
MLPLDSFRQLPREAPGNWKDSALARRGCQVQIGFLNIFNFFFTVKRIGHICHSAETRSYFVAP